MFLWKRIKNALPLCPNLLWGVRGLLCCCGSWDPEMYSNLQLPPINFAGFLAAVPGQVRTMRLCEREKKKKKSLFFFHRLLIEMARLQKPQELEYHRDKPTKQICTSQRGLLHLQAADVSLFHSLLAVNRRKTFTSFCTSPYTAHLKNQRAGAPITWTNCRLYHCKLSVSQRTGETLAALPLLLDLRKT